MRIGLIGLCFITFLYGLVYTQIWMALGLPFDVIAAFDYSAAILPVLAMMVFAL